MPTSRAPNYPFVIRGGFTRRRKPDDPFLVDLDVNYHFTGPGKPPETRLRVVDWREVFEDDRPLRVEVGFGKSDFLIEVARQTPDFNYIGFEYSAKRVTAFLRKVHRHDVHNIRAVCCDATAILDRVFEPASIQRFFVLFPDPWPKRRHARNRFVRTENMETASGLLGPGAGLTLRTDDRAYAKQMLGILDARSDLVNLAGEGNFATEPREPVRTLYEKKFLEMGRRIYYLEYDRGCDHEL